MPRVVTSSVKVVFCEGSPDSLDALFLWKNVPIGVLVQSAGGKHGIRAYIEGYLGSYGTDTPPFYLAFRDRDFDVEPPAHPQLVRLRGEKSIWLSHRASVENYMIDADLLCQYWTERENTPGWAHGPALAEETIESHITGSARELTDYQAVRWALARLKTGERWPEIRTTWTDGSGDIPPSLEYEDCLTQACQLVASFQSQEQAICPERVQEYAEVYRERFCSQRFFEERGYLVWFHGKDHLTLLCRLLAPNFPRRHYASWAAEHVDIRKHADLQQLISLISQ